MISWKDGSLALKYPLEWSLWEECKFLVRCYWNQLVKFIYVALPVTVALVSEGSRHYRQLCILVIFILQKWSPRTVLLQGRYLRPQSFLFYIVDFLSVLTKWHIISVLNWIFFLLFYMLYYLYIFYYCLQFATFSPYFLSHPHDTSSSQRQYCISLCLFCHFQLLVKLQNFCALAESGAVSPNLLST